jgi:tetratricopeptide (TPR) repeat protein
VPIPRPWPASISSEVKRSGAWAARTRPEALAQTAVDAFTAARGADDPVTLAARNQLANAIKHAGRPQDAEPLYRQLLADRTRVLSATHLDTLITEHNLALAIFMQAKAATDPAVKSAKLDEAIDIESGNWARTKRSLGAGHEQALAAGSEVAAMLQSADRLGDAERVYAEIVPVMRDRLGGGHWRTRTTGANYGRLLLKAGRLDRAVAPWQHRACVQHRGTENTEGHREGAQRKGR